MIALLHDVECRQVQNAGFLEHAQNVTLEEILCSRKNFIWVGALNSMQRVYIQLSGPYNRIKLVRIIRWKTDCKELEKLRLLDSIQNTKVRKISARV